MSTDRKPLGKFGKKSLENYVFPYLDKAKGECVSPKFGSDFNTVELDGEKILVVSTDPLAVSPQLGWKRSGRLALQVITADVAVSGIPPVYLISNWNLPSSTEDRTFEKIWQGFTEEATQVGVSIVGGHTGRYEGSNFPTIGAATAFGVGERKDLVRGDLSSGDRIYLLNRLGLEAAAIFAFYYPEKLSTLIPTSDLSSVKRKFDDLQPTGDLNLLSSLPGVKLLHDIAEGGLLGGLQEMLSSKSCGALIRKNQIKIEQDVEKVCDKLNLDPLRITSIGSGLAVVERDREDQLLQALDEYDLPVRAIGEITESTNISIEGTEEVETLKKPVRDEFWDRLSEFKNFD